MMKTSLILAVAFIALLGQGVDKVTLAVGLSMVGPFARTVRSDVLQVKAQLFVEAAALMSIPRLRVVLRHILPNIAGPVMVIAASNFAAAILIEAGLSFLGIGVQPPMPSWGLMIKEHYNFLVTNRPFLAIVPGLAIMVLVYAFNVLGNALRDELDVRG